MLSESVKNNLVLAEIDQELAKDKPDASVVELYVKHLEPRTLSQEQIQQIMKLYNHHAEQTGERKALIN